MFEELLRKAAQALEAAGIPYMVIGGQAVLVYGSPRMTQDIDITLGIAPDRAGEILNLADKAGWQVLTEDPQAFVAATFVLPVADKASGIRLDLIFSFTPFEEQAISRAVRMDIGGTSVAFVSVEDLIIHKIFAGRPRDLEDVRLILAKNPEVDSRYIEEWLQTMSEGADIDLLARFKSIQG